MNPITFDAIKILMDIQCLEYTSPEDKEAAKRMISKLLTWMETDVDAVVAKTSKLLN